jgi:hypothetical protein
LAAHPFLPHLIYWPYASPPISPNAATFYNGIFNGAVQHQHLPFMVTQ